MLISLQCGITDAEMSLSVSPARVKLQRDMQVARLLPAACQGLHDQNVGHAATHQHALSEEASR